MHDFLFQTWWRWGQSPPTWTDIGYSWFNVAEAVAWFAIALYVLDRWRRYRHSEWELVYGVTFIVFGLSDVAESMHVQPWLIAAKGLIAAALVAMRIHLVRRHYVGWKF